MRNKRECGYKTDLDSIKYKKPEYDENDRNSDKEFNMIRWSRSLNKYKTSRHDDKWVYYYNPLFTVIYDKFPKSFIHLLVLPIDISFIVDDKIYFATKPSHFRIQHLPKLKLVHNHCRIIANKLIEEFPDLGLKIKIGYHIYPSMDDLHIHIISDDFKYIRNKHQKKSFNKKSFISIDEVESLLATFGGLFTHCI